MLRRFPRSSTRSSCILTIVLAICLSGISSGCDVASTIVKSEAKLDEVLKEPVIQVTHADDAYVLKVGEFLEAQAIIVGDAQHWKRYEQEHMHSVSLSLRMIDVETGLLLFSGEGHLSDPTSEDPERSARLIVHRLLALF